MPKVPEFVAFSFDEFPILLSGTSNDKILRKTVEYVITNSVDLVVIGWSNLGRSEFADEFGYYDIWPGYGGNMFIRDGTEWRG